MKIKYENHTDSLQNKSNNHCRDQRKREEQIAWAKYCKDQVKSVYLNRLEVEEDYVTSRG